MTTWVVIVVASAVVGCLCGRFLRGCVGWLAAAGLPWLGVLVFALVNEFLLPYRGGGASLWTIAAVVAGSVAAAAGMTTFAVYQASSEARSNRFERDRPRANAGREEIMEDTKELPLRARLTAGLEIAAAVGVLVADGYHLVPFSNTPFLLLLGWMSLRLRGLRWRSVGFYLPPDWLRALAIGVVAGVALEALALLVTEPLIAWLSGSYPDLDELRPLVGNPTYLLIGLALNWTLAAFGEEMVWRGYLLSRFADLFAGARWRWLAGLVLVSVLFGWAHRESQGWAGMAQEGLAGLLLGVLYLRCGRRLAVPIVAHGISNTVALVLTYYDLYPGV